MIRSRSITEEAATKGIIKQRFVHYIIFSMSIGDKKYYSGISNSCLETNDPRGSWSMPTTL
jgi:hypothetical protein